MHRVKIFRFVDKWLNRFAGGILMIHHGIWLGMMDRNALQSATDAYYASSARYSDKIYLMSGFLPWEARALSRYFGNCRSFLVAAAGSGREVIALSKRNFEVDAFECAEELVRIGRQLLASQNIDIQLNLAPPDQVPPGLGIYDGLIVGWGAYMHISGRDNRVHFLQQLRHHAPPDSPILISFFTRDTQSKYYDYVFAIARVMRRLRRSAEPVELGDDLDPTFVHRFVKSEITDEFSAGGFDLVYFADLPYGHAVARAK